MKLSISFSRPFLLLLLLLLLLSPSSLSSVNALNVGVQLANEAINESVRQCSRKCESQHCSVPPFMRYGKYCGILYTGCPGEKPCDALDACCMVHDACVQSKNNDYLSNECNGQLVDCIEKVKAAGDGKAKATFKGNKCTVEEVADVIETVMEAALLAGRVIRNP